MIHFPAMSIDEFTKIVVPAGLLEVDEENAVFRALLGAASDTSFIDGSSSAETATTTKKAPPAFPSNSRNFVTTRCDINYDGYMRHGASSSSVFRGGAMPHRSGWSLTVYCDHSIKVLYTVGLHTVCYHYHCCLLTVDGRTFWQLARDGVL